MENHQAVLFYAVPVVVVTLSTLEQYERQHTRVLESRFDNKWAIWGRFLRDSFQKAP
jgi:hypothetical protein